MHWPSSSLRAALLCAAFIAPAPAVAVTQIDAVRWVTPSTLSGCGAVATTFAATITATDISQGVRFSLQERDPGGNDLLLDVALPWTAPLPPVGTEVRIWTELGICCSSTDRLSGSVIYAWTVTWCAAPEPQQVRTSMGSTPALKIGASDPEAFELVLVDENGVEGANPTAEDVIACGAGPEMVPAGTLPPWPADWVQAGGGLRNPDPLFAPELGGRPGTASESPGTMSLYFDATGQQVCGTAAPLTPLTLYLVLHTSGITRCGIAGAEFRITNIPAGWFASIVPVPGLLIVGQPLGDGGGVAFGRCLPDASGIINVCTIQALPTSFVSDHAVQLTQANPSSNPLSPCPWVVLCDYPVLTGVCVEGGTAILNPSPKTPCGGTVGVRAQTWGAVKRLYD